MNLEKIDRFFRVHARVTFRSYPKFLAVGACVLWGLLWLYGLGDRALSEPDEGRYAEVAREMWATGDWLSPRLDGFYFFDKPPLQYWLSAIAYSLFGATPFSARLWSALTGLLAVTMTGWAGYRLFGRSAGISTALVLGSSFLFVLGSHINTLDMGVAAFLTTAMACFLIAHFDATVEHRRNTLNLVMWVALALAILSKGLIGVVLPAGALAVYVLWTGDWIVIRRTRPLTGMAVALTIALPWFVLMCRAHSDFFHYFFIRQHFTRFLTTADNRNKPLWFFVPVVLIGLFPWTVFIPWTRISVKKLDLSGSAQRFILSWIGVVFVFFTISKSKLPLYILPLFPAAALLIGLGISRMSEKEVLRRIWCIVGLAMAGAVAIQIAVSYLGATTKSIPLRDGLQSMLIAVLFIECAALISIAFMYSRRRQTSLCVLALMTMIGWQLALHTFASFNEYPSSERAAELIKPYTGDRTTVYIVQGDLRGLPFYLGRLATIVDHDDDDISHGVTSRPQGYMNSIAQFAKVWNTSSDEVALVPLESAAGLAQSGLQFCSFGTAGNLLAIRRVPNQDRTGPQFHRR